MILINTDKQTWTVLKQCQKWLQRTGRVELTEQHRNQAFCVTSISMVTKKIDRFCCFLRLRQDKHIFKVQVLVVTSVPKLQLITDHHETKTRENNDHNYNTAVQFMMYWLIYRLHTPIFCLQYKVAEPCCCWGHPLGGTMKQWKISPNNNDLKKHYTNSQERKQRRRDA